MKPALFQNPGMHRTLPLARSLNDRSTTCSELIQRMIPLLRVSLAPFAGFFVRPWKSVRTSPGQRLCTLMPRPLTSMAIDSARLFRKAFVAQYTALLGRGKKAASDATATIVPSPRATILRWSSVGACLKANPLP